MEIIAHEIVSAYGNWHYAILYVFFLLIGLLFITDARKKLLFPALFISIVVLNPILYKYWNKINGYAYWRTLWMIPVITVCAAIPAFAVESIKRIPVKIFITVLTVTIFIVTGSLVYNYPNTSFSKADNPDKLPADVANVGKALLELEEEPYIAADPKISVYIREYSGKIKTMYTRDPTYGGASTSQGDIVYHNLVDEDGELSVVAQYMLNYDYDYLVTANTDDTRRKDIEAAGFELIRQVNDYGIFRVTGKQTEIRTYNDLHQVDSVTLVSRDGNPANNEEGYAIIKYAYDEKGVQALKYYYDQDGCPLEMGSGWLHDFFTSLEDKNVSLYISAKDDASRGMNEAIVKDMQKLGLKKDLRGKPRNSYYAIITKGSIQEDLGEQVLEYNGKIGENTISIISAGWDAGNQSSIKINGVEYSTNVRGLNIVVLDNDKGEVIDSFGVDSSSQEMKVYR